MGNQVSHLHALLDYEYLDFTVSVSHLHALIEYSYPGPTQVSTVMVLIEVTGEPAGVETHGTMIEGVYTPEGMGEPIFGDRAAWNVVDYPEMHSVDLKNSKPVHHVTPGDTLGQIPIWDGEKYEPGFQPAGSISVREAGVDRGPADTFDFYGISALVAGGIATIRPRQALIHPLISSFPYSGAPTVTSVNVHTTTACRVFPFYLPYSGAWANFWMRTNAAVASCLNIGIYSIAGVKLWEATGLSTVATGWISTSMSALNLPAGNYFLATANNNASSTSNAYTVTPALATSGIPPTSYLGTIPTTLGALPASFDPAADITPHVGGYMAYSLLERAL
jgi:hypothetical protein